MTKTLDSKSRSYLKLKANKQQLKKSKISYLISENSSIGNILLNRLLQESLRCNEYTYCIYAD